MTKNSAAELKAFCQTLKIIANPSRLRILLLLVNGEASVSDIEINLGIKQPSLSHELKRLRDASLVVTRRESKAMFYSIADDGSKRLIKNVASLMQTGTLDHTASKTSRLPLDIVPVPVAQGECGQFSLVHEN